MKFQKKQYGFDDVQLNIAGQKTKPTCAMTLVGLVMIGASVVGHADEIDHARALPTIPVSGIRASLQQSLAAKRDADSLIEVVTAEDIGKMPDKNIADSLQRIPGVNTSSAAGGEGGFDENDRVSIRATSPSLTQTLMNGHAIGTGDWFILNQIGNVGRSVSYSLLPSELVGRVVVHKSATADMVEGGVSGTVNIETRRPLEFTRSVTAEGSVGAVYSDLAKKTDPQLSALFNWKNEAGTLGFLVQGFSQTRHIRRDGQEPLGYSTINAANTPAIVAARPDLDGVVYPTLIGSVLFEQERKREGGAFEVQIKPDSDLMLALNGLHSSLSAKNYTQNFMAWPDSLLTSGVVPTSTTVKNGTLTQASFPVQGDHPAGVVDSIYRPGSSAETWFLNLDGKWRASNRLMMSGQIGTTKGTGETSKEVAFEGNINRAGLNYSMNGLASPVAVSFPGANVADFAGTTFGWAWGDKLRTLDTERYGALAGEYTIGSGIIESVQFGARFANHERSIDYPIAVGPSSSSPATLPAWNGTLYPANFGTGLGGGVLNQIWFLKPADVEAWADQNLDNDPARRRNWAAEFSVKESTTAGYAMANLSDQGWRANAGVRLVRTDQTTTNNVGNPPDPETGMETGFRSVVTKRSYTDVLPSANIRFDLSRDVLLRAGLARTIARPDFSALGGAVTLDNIQRTGTAGNANLNPVRSTNVDVSAEWYFAPKSLLHLGLFYMDMSSYVSLATAPAQFFNDQTGRFETFQITSPVNTGATNKGIELSYQQPLSRNVGILANYTFADGKEDDGSDLVGSSRHTYNLTGYVETDQFYARLAYSYRSDFLVGLDRSFAQYEAGTGNLAASLGYRLNRNVMLCFEALNLNNPTLKYYGVNKDQPRAFYTSGRQFYLSLRAQM